MKKLIFFTLIAIALLGLLTACGGGATTTGTAVTQTPTTTQIQKTTTPATTGPTATTKPPTTTPASTIDADNNVAVKMVDLLYNLEAVQNYYADGVNAMATFQVESTKSGARATGAGAKVPQEFKNKLPPKGAMPAPAGACPAAAEPKVTFKTKADKPVTPEMIVEKALESVPTEHVTVAQGEANSLVSIIENMVQLGDTRLATPEGWNILLWDKLKDLHKPAESLWDYQLWNAAPEIETEIADLYYQRLVAAGAPPIVLSAYKQSNTHGWYANQQAKPEDALAQMDIEAKLTGSFNGVVHEQRDFTIEGAGQTPTYGIQTGDGIVTWNAPGVGPVDMSVDIKLDKYDEMGRAIGGMVVADAIKYEGYQVVFTFKPDGSKDGVVFKDGKPVGELTMTVDHSKFENYVDIKSGTVMKIPDDIKPK
jgi:hypothetical protein